MWGQPPHKRWLKQDDLEVDPPGCRLVVEGPYLDVVKPSVVVCTHFVNHLPDCCDDGVRRFRHVVVRVHDYLPTAC